LNVANYAGFKTDPDFAIFLCQLDKANTTGFSYEQFYAFWINAYNAVAVYTIITNPCKFDLFGKCGALTSILQIDLQQPALPIGSSPVWKKKVYTIGGEHLCLDDIENSKLRNPMPHFKLETVELHCAIVCASISCPNLRNESFTPEKLYDQLASNTIEFLSNRQKGAKLSGTTLTLSPIFNWFQNDFNNKTGFNGVIGNFANLADFILKYTNNTASKDIYNYVEKNKNAVNTITFQTFSYDWNLNGDVSSLCNENRLCISYIYIIIAAFLVLITVIIVTIILVRRKASGYDAVN